MSRHVGHRMPQARSFQTGYPQLHQYRDAPLWSGAEGRTKLKITTQREIYWEFHTTAKILSHSRAIIKSKVLIKLQVESIPIKPKKYIYFFWQSNVSPHKLTTKKFLWSVLFSSVLSRLEAKKFWSKCKSNPFQTNPRRKNKYIWQSDVSPTRLKTTKIFCDGCLVSSVLSRLEA
jgi:hypothetical protein